MTAEEMAKEYEEKAECVEIGKDINVPIKWHDLRKNPDDLPEPSGEMRAQRKPVLAYTKVKKRSLTVKYIVFYCCFRKKIAEKIFL